MNPNSASDASRIDKVRASRAGHTFHDTWTARVALELLLPTTDLAAIAVEGLSTEDAGLTSDSATEIADLVRYRGGLGVKEASSVEVIQFKYSIAKASVPVRAADLQKTFRKFSEAESDFERVPGRSPVTYEVVTNRPIHNNLLGAIRAICDGRAVTGDVGKQAAEVIAACGLETASLVAFLSRLTLSGQSDMLVPLHSAVHRTIANWGGATDTLSRLRLANLVELCREKAGPKGQHNNLIARVDVLAALEIAHEEELFPTPDAFPSVGQTIDRPITGTIARAMVEPGTPVLVHAPGGMGKTVVMQALAKRFEGAGNEVVLFDCFGAGRWKDPADSRHSPQRALPHIANLLAAKGLCDLLLPGSSAIDLTQAFCARLAQSVAAVRAVNSDARVVLLLDAIDHCGLQAAETHTESFPHLVLKSLSITPIDGVFVVASCRTERQDIAINGASCRKIPIGALLPTETANLVTLRDNTATEAEIAALHSRSGGNPRVLDALLQDGRPYDQPGPGADNARQPNDKLLDELLRRRIDRATIEAERRGVPRDQIDALLAGLALLPPPVPVIELAIAQGRTEAAIESFAADLYPLLEHTPHGLIFRDEPTETFIRTLFTGEATAQEAVVKRLQGRQDHSSYAARALPIVLTVVGRTDDLVKLAFHDRLPETATSRVAQRAIRLSRLVAAILACSAKKRADDLTELLLEAARVAGGHERADAFLRDHPDLVAVSGDPEAVRRLFEVKSGWPGSRHAAQAILHAVSDELGEARRHARRAFDWLNWRMRQPEDNRHSPLRAATDDQDLFGPAYAEALAGNTLRVGRWLDQWNERYAYTLYSKLAILLETHGVLSAEARALRLSVLRRAVSCRSSRRGLGAAILQHSHLSTSDRRKVIGRLASVSKASPPILEEVDYHFRERRGLADALSTAAMQAICLGDDDHARTILDGIGLQRQDLAQFGSHWPNATAVARVFSSAAIRAAIDRRTPHLRDVAPKEIHSALRFRTDAPRATDYEKAVQRLLTPAADGASQPRRRRRKPRLADQQRNEASRVLQHRVRPLLPLTAAVAKLLRARDVEGAVSSVLKCLSEAVSSVQPYPFQDAAYYVGRVGFLVTISALDAADALTADTSSRLAHWLIESPVKSQDLWIDVVALFSGRPETGESAMVLARQTEALILADTNVDDKIAAYGALARAILRTSRAEAQAYFRKGLDIADAIGSDDYQTASDLIDFAAHYRGEPLQQEVAHTLARICELTLSDEDRFPWTDFGEAMARIGGTQALSVVARWADREKASLGLSLPPLLTSLVRHSRLSPELAAGVVGLAKQTRSSSWSIVDFAQVTLPGLSARDRETAMGYLLTEIDRRYQGRPPHETAVGLQELGQKYLSSSSEARRELDALAILVDPGVSRSGNPRDLEPRLEGEEARRQIAATVDASDAESIDAALAQNAKHAIGRPSVQVLEAIADRVRSVDDRLLFLRAVAAAKVPTLADKLLALGTSLPDWKTSSLAISDFMPAFVNDVTARHADELVGSEWESGYALRKLIEFSGQAPVAVVSAIMGALRGRASEIGGNAWMRFACIAARTASPQAIAADLRRFTSMAASELPQEIGDGDWRPDLTVPDNHSTAVAGLVWLRLGSPELSERWRAAHAIRRLMALGQHQVIFDCIEGFGRETIGPFQDQKLPFFVLHARFWLLVALARVSLDHPEALVTRRDFLEEIAFSRDSPHVGMKAFAAAALRAILEVLEAREATALAARLDTVNVSPFARVAENRDRRGFYDSRPREGTQEPVNPFHFEYDYSKMEVDSLASVFGLDHSAVVEMATGWIRRWSVDVKNMWECPRRPHDYPNHSRDRSQRHTWGAYLAWHSLMLTAGELSQTKAVGDSDYKDDPWGDWLSDYGLTRKDGLWLSDATDRFPRDLARHVMSSNDPKHVPADPTELGWLAGIDGKAGLSDGVTIDGSWKSTDRLDISIDSVLVVPELAESVAFAALTPEPFDRWFPGDDDLRRPFRRRLPLRRLFREANRHEYARLDDTDPYASPTANRRSVVAPAAIRCLELKANDVFRRAWCDGSGANVFHGDAWGVKDEDGNGGRSGNRLRLRKDGLVRILRTTRRCLLILIKVQKYLERDGHAATAKRRRRRRNPERPVGFATQTLVVIVGRNGQVRAVQRIPATVRAAVNKLPESQNHEFGYRLRAIVKVRLAKYLTTATHGA